MTPRPSHLDQLFQTAVQHHQAGRLRDAEMLYRQILAQQPRHADVLNLLGVLAAQVGQIDAAIELIRQSIVLKPQNPQAFNNLGKVLKAAGRIDEAIAAYQKAIVLRPDYPEALSNLGNALRDSGQTDEAIDAYRRAIKLKPDFAEAHYNYSAALYERGEFDEAVVESQKAIKLRPDLAEAHGTAGNVLKDTGQLDEAIAAYRQAIALRPGDPDAASNLLYTLHFHPDSDARLIAREAARWNEKHAQPLAVMIRQHENERVPDRRLRIGYVSPDFRQHPVGRFMLPLLANHDHANVEVFCYAQVARPDALTAQLRQHADHWYSIVGLSDEQAADLVRQHQIDILVDLTMHMANHRLLLFARKPAPVQITYLAYCSTTGLSAMDCRLSDPYLDPLGSDESVYSERTIRLPRSYWCYQPGDSPAVGPVPAIESGRITFGSLNNFCKVTQPTMSTWGRLLKAVSDSRLLLHAHPGSHRQRTAQFFRKMGVDPNQIQFVGMVGIDEYLKLYQQIDIALDPFPYVGGTTSCDALWMGVPVVTLQGQTAVGRGGVSILSNLGLPELIARSEDEYVRIAAALAEDRSRLSQLRTSLRQRMQASPLMDAAGFARDVESIYREVWRRWCAETASPEHR